MSGGAGGMRGGSGGMMNQFINPAAAGNGMMNGGPQANFNGMNVGNRQPFKGGTTEAQMQANVRNYLAAKNGQMPAGAFSNGVMGTNMDPRRSPDVAAPWRVAQPYAGPVTGNVQPPNPTGYYPYGPNANNGAGPANPPNVPGPSPAGYQNPPDMANPPNVPGPSPTGYQNPPDMANPPYIPGRLPAGIGGPTGGNPGPTRAGGWGSSINPTGQSYMTNSPFASYYSGLLGRS